MTGNGPTPPLVDGIPGLDCPQHKLNIVHFGGYYNTHTCTFKSSNLCHNYCATLSSPANCN